MQYEEPVKTAIARQWSKMTRLWPIAAMAKSMSGQKEKKGHTQRARSQRNLGRRDTSNRWNTRTRKMKKKNTKKIEAAKEDRLPSEEVLTAERANTKQLKKNQMTASNITKNRREKIQTEGLKEMIYLVLELSHQAEEI
jgi:hypothetical protein